MVLFLDLYCRLNFSFLEFHYFYCGISGPSRLLTGSIFILHHMGLQMLEQPFFLHETPPTVIYWAVHVDLRGKLKGLGILHVTSLDMTLELSHVVILLVALNTVKGFFIFMNFQMLFESLKCTKEKATKIIWAGIEFFSVMCTKMSFQLIP